MQELETQEVSQHPWSRNRGVLACRNRHRRVSTQVSSTRFPWSTPQSWTLLSAEWWWQQWKLLRLCLIGDKAHNQKRCGFPPWICVFVTAAWVSNSLHVMCACKGEVEFCVGGQLCPDLAAEVVLRDSSQTSPLPTFLTKDGAKGDLKAAVFQHRLLSAPKEAIA